MIVKKIMGISLLVISTTAVADFCPCPSNFNLIQIGTSLDQVLKTCCAPIARNTHKAELPVPQKWSYNITPPINPGNAIQASVEMIITFDETEKVTNISVNSQSLSATNCGTSPVASFDVSMPNTVRVGDTMATVKKTCGPPKFIQRGEIQPQTAMQTAPTVTELQYAGPPPVTLIFENGALKEIRK